VKCRACRGPAAVIELRRHNAAFCARCFVTYCHTQVARAIEDHAMLQPGQRCLVAVSGGKDSLALWAILLELGYQADGLYIGLGIGGYSGPSAEYVRRFAEQRSVRLTEVDLPGDHGFDVRSGAAADGRAPCSACGLSKRHIFDRSALEGGYDVVATGHNLDDEAAVLLGNVLHWDLGFMARQRPMLPGGGGFPCKVKPLVRLSERETAAYCIVRGIDYQVEECPMAAGNRHLGYKDALNAIEERSPGTKASFYSGFLARASELVSHVAEEERAGLHPCTNCGAPTTASLCAFCRLVKRSAAKSQQGAGGRETVPVEAGAP